METMHDLFRRLEQLNEIGAALSLERDIAVLLEKILIAAKEITHADGGSLYRLADDGKSLKFEIVRTNSLGIAHRAVEGQALTHGFSDVPLYLPDGRPNESMMAAYVALTGKTVNVADAYTAEGFDFSGTRRFDQKTGYRSRSVLTVPMTSYDGEILGVLQLINAISPETGAVMCFRMLTSVWLSHSLRRLQLLCPTGS